MAGLVVGSVATAEAEAARKAVVCIEDDVRCQLDCLLASHLAEGTGVLVSLSRQALS